MGAYKASATDLDSFFLLFFMSFWDNPALINNGAIGSPFPAATYKFSRVIRNDAVVPVVVRSYNNW